MVCKKRLFSGLNPDDIFDDRVHLAELVALLGPPPLEFIKRSPVGHVFWDAEGMLRNLVIPVVLTYQADGRALHQSPTPL